MSVSLRRHGASPRARATGKNHLVAWVWIGAVCLAALVGAYVMFVEPPPPRKIVIASGGKNGAYSRVAEQYAAELRKEGLSVEVRTTAGSVENLRLLGQPDSGVSVAIVQGGVANEHDLESCDALGSMYREPLWIFYRAGTRIERLAQLAGKRVGIGPAGSGTEAMARRLLEANGLVEDRRTVLVSEDVATAAGALQRGELDAAFFVAGFQAEYIQRLLRDDRVALLSFEQHEAYQRRFRFLDPVTLPTGLVDLGRNLPREDVALLAPTAMLVVRKDLHPALIPLLLTIATQIHGTGNELAEPGEFPTESFCDFPISEHAKRFYKSGQPVLQRLLPFWVASLVDRAKIMLIPLVMLMMPLVRVAPPLLRWRTRRKIYVWYSDLRAVDQRLLAGNAGPALEHDLARLRAIERQVAHIDVPLSYME